MDNSILLSRLLRRMIKHASVMKLLLLSGLYLPVPCTSAPVLNSTTYQSSHLERDVLPGVNYYKSYEQIYRPCNEVLCNDGRCVSQSWLCTDIDAKDSALPSMSENPENRQEGGSAFFRYGMAMVGMIIIALLILISVCGIADEEDFVQHRNSSHSSQYPKAKYTVLKNANADKDWENIPPVSKGKFFGWNNGSSEKGETVSEVRVEEV